MRLFAVGWTPTDAGLVVNLEQGERFLLSVMVSGDFDNNPATPNEEREFFVSNYNRYSGGYYNYTAGSFMKLLPATEVTEMNEWSVGAPLARGNKALGGISYTIWNDGKTLKTSDTFKFLGDLTSDYADAKACDVVFVIPTERGVPTVQGRAGLSSFDPNNTLGRGKAPFNGRMGTGFLGMTYREVYMFDIPKANSPQSYTNSALVTFNTTLSTWKLGSGAGDIAKGKAAYAYADSKHDKTPRTIFRLYLLDNPINSCSSYFFATDEQDYVRYRMNENNPQKSSDSTAAKKIYTIDHMTCMSRIDDTKYYQTDLLRVPEPDSTYYYVGYDNKYKDDTGESMGSGTAKSNFTKIRELPMKDLMGFNAPAGAMGRMVVDTSSSAYNLGVAFDPAGYFLKVSTGKNVRMRKTGENEWTTQDMWTIDGSWVGLTIRATLMTGPEFSDEDPGVDIVGWSKDTLGSKVPVKGHPGLTPAGQSGYARIYTNRTDANGAMEFILANKKKHIHYDNNGFLGVEIPNQYPLEDETTTIVQAPRLKAGYTFDGWNTKSDGSGDTIQANTVLTLASVSWLGDTVLNLYALAHYEGTLQVAISFIHPTDKKRYYLTHPGAAAPRYARARHFEDWENTWQGMENAENLDPNYISTFEMRYPINEVNHKEDPDEADLSSREKVLDPRRYVMKGYEDSLIFYEHFAPARDEYLGLYYTTPNTILANNTWAGLFETTSDTTPTGWPDYQVPYIPRTKLKSIRYVEEYDATKPDSLVLKKRSNWEQPWVHYNESDNQFDGVASVDDATEFEISSVVVADAHYIIVPDTSEAWRDTIEFAYHQNELIAEPVWSQLIGKQLLACMMVGGDTTYFHPNLKKEISDPNNLYLSPDYRVSMVFDLIRDSRVTAPLPEGDSVKHETTDYHWHNEIVSGINSPINVKDKSGNYIDIVDTFRITLSHGGVSKIKEYRGLWNARDAHVKANADGSSRYRDVIVRTKTYHYGDTTTQLVLRPQYETYSFSPLKDSEKRINFTLLRETSCSLLDKEGTPVSSTVIARDTVKNTLSLGPSSCSLKGSDFTVVPGKTTSDHVTLATAAENTSGVKLDTLTVTTTVNDTVITAKVPLMQAALTSNELLWSVTDGNKRYFIMPKRVGETYSFVFRQYRVNNSIMYKENSSTHLVKGSKDAANSDNKYITPWEYKYKSGDKTQLTLKAVLTSTAGDTAHFAVRGGAPAAHPTDSAFLTYKLIATYTNDNANYEEQVKLRYGDPETGKWLKFTGGGSPSLSLVDKEADASVFSWSYLVQEYNLLNNGTYPSRDFAEFGYNDRTPVSIQTLYKAYKEYSTLLNNSVTYLCRQEETNVANLRNGGGEWLTDISFRLIRDSRFGAEKDSSKLAITPDYPTLTTTVSTAKFSPIGTQYGGEYVNIVDTLDVRLSLQTGAPAYRFKGDWSGFKSVDDAHLKLPLIRRTYHLAPFDSLYAVVDNDQYSYTFPAAITKGTNDSCVFSISTLNRTGSHMLNVEGESVMSSGTSVDVTDLMDLSNKNLAEVRLADDYGNTPDWCHIRRKTENTIVIECTENGIRSPRTAYLYMAYIVMLDPDGEGGEDPEMRFVNYRLTVAQASSFEYANNQRLIHTGGASGDEPMDNGMQQVHTNKRVLYYYPDQDVELPVRERAFYGWWRWYREGNDVNGNDVSDTDIPDSLWRVAPRNEGKYIFPFHTIGDSVDDGAGGKKLVTMGRFSVFHYKSKDYGNKQDPPAKNPRVAPPTTEFGGAKPVLTYAVDISNYYDNLPMSLKDKNQVDIDLLDTTLTITEPTLSLRELFELRPWTEMAERMEDYKDPIASPCTNLDYMEDHTVMAPIGNRLLLQTEQRYNLEHLTKRGLSESLLGYYMRDDNWSTGGWSDERKDTMIWCGGWDADCLWYTYDPKKPDVTERYTPCTHPVTEEDDFLQVPAKTTISTGHEFDTVYYCLRARSRVTTGTPGDDEEDNPGAYMFNICRYKIIYHNPKQYGPLVESKTNGVAKAIITNDEIEQRYDVLERLDFDYIKPGKDYHIYPHPLPWDDASYGYTYPETPDLPHNRYHDESDFPNHGEYGLINRIPYSSYWHKMEQHGGAENGYMIYCDGMSSSGQVAALTLNTNLCAGQKMFFSAYVGNPSSQKGKSNPNFIFSVQGMTDQKGAEWEDITSYMTGDIQPSNQWYQIYFPITHTKGGREEYSHFRVRIYNVSNSFDGNDFIIDDMCIFATKPPLIVYQANTTCKKYGEADADTHVLLRIDYQGITGEGYNGTKVYYTVKQMTPDSVYSFVPLTDGYMDDSIAYHIDPDVSDTLLGKIYIPARDYEPSDKDSIYRNMNHLIQRFDTTTGVSKVREGYIYEILEGDIRPVKYIVHSARMDPKNEYTVHMSATYAELLNSMCGMTSHLKISNRMVLELNGEEQPEVETFGLCANSTYDISLRVRGSLYLDSVAPIDVTGSCVNDWLLYGDTVRASSLERYGYCYDDIVKVVKDILRYMPMSESEENSNQFAPNLTSVSREEMERIQLAAGVDLETSDHPYDVLTSLVNNGFLKLYKRNMTVTVTTGDSVEYVIMPIVGTGSKEVMDANVEVCPNPIYIKLKPNAESGLPLVVGGLHRDSTQLAEPVEVLTSSATVNSSFKLRVDSIMPNVGIYTIELRNTDDPDFLPGVHTLKLEPDRAYPSGSYYVKGDSIILRPAASNNYKMQPGYHYTFNIVMQTIFGKLRLENGCEVGIVPFILSVVPDYLRWNPQSPENNNWNEAENWVAINEHNEIIDSAAHFVPMAHTNVVIPKKESNLPYPVLPALPLPYKDSVQKVNFQYNTCSAIRFLPEAAMGQQQHMDYIDAVVDMSVPYNTWAFRGAPVKGMISGDLFRAEADLSNETPLWEVGEFDASGRNYTTGNATFWLSMYSRTTLRKGNGTETKDTVRNAAADWSKVTNGLSLPMPAGMGWSVYARSNVPDETSVVRLPKQDDKYYYYNKSGEKMFDLYEQNLQALRTTVAGGSGAGQLAFHADYEEYTITNDNSVETTSFVFGNPSMGYVDIWGFVADNCLKQEIDYIDPSGTHRTVSRAYAESNVSEDVISNQMRYLPPMHAMMVKLRDGEAAVNSKTLILNSYRVLTEVSQKEPAIYACGVSGGDQGLAQAPQRSSSTNDQSSISAGIMTITALNPVSPRCNSRLVLGQGYRRAVVEGEDAVLTTVNIDNFHMTNTPTTPFNIYAMEDGYGLSIDLRDSIVNIPIAFYMSALPYDPTTQLWFTGVNNIHGSLVLYDALTDTERPIYDGICLSIETPEANHERRYYIRRRGFKPGENIDPDDPIATGWENQSNGEQVIKIIRNGLVYILRGDHVYTLLGQQVR